MVASASASASAAVFATTATAAAASAAASHATLARFQLLRELGRGAQAKVWLAHDPRLDREVALKLLDRAAGAQAISEWLNEARAVSRLTHPNIVPVFEADVHDGQPYLVFEFVDGPTLAQARRGRPPMPAVEAATLMLAVLDALAAAHAQGLVHRDLKPSNILLGSDGRARVMDFGIAARVASLPAPTPGPAPGPAAGPRDRAALTPADGSIVGTAGYISPEAARGEAPQPAMDVFAAGAVLGELLSGAPLLRETDPARALQRVQHEDLMLAPAAEVDDTLRGIVGRALSRDPATRYDSARAMHAALSAWLQPAPAAGAADAVSQHATLEFLLRRMRHKTDFPALSSAVVRIQRVAQSETDSLTALSDEILKDVALTNKLLRMVNTAHFSSAAGGAVGTVSRAVALVGFAGIRNMALSVVLLENMSNKGHAAQLKEEFLRALMAGTLAGELAPASREGEDAFLAAMFQNLGRLLTECYFPEEAVQIRQRLPAASATTAQREAAARHVLGIDFDALGAGIAKAWGLPETLQRALRAPDGPIPVRPPAPLGPGGSIERLRWLGRGANALADAMLGSDGATQAGAIAMAAAQLAPALGLSAGAVIAATHAARERLTHLAQAMHLHVTQDAPARRLLQPAVSGVLSSPGTAGDGCDAPTLVQPRLPLSSQLSSQKSSQQSPQQSSAASAEPRTGQAAALRAEELAATLAELSDGGSGLRLNDVLHKVLDSMHRALHFQRVLLCLREPGGRALAGRFAVGTDAAATSAAFRFVPDLAAVDNLFAWLCAKGADLLVSDAASVSARLPAWYRSRVNAPTFLLLPVMLQGTPIGLIYADKATAGSIVLAERQLLLLRGLRDQTAGAFARGQKTTPAG